MRGQSHQNCVEKFETVAVKNLSEMCVEGNSKMVWLIEENDLTTYTLFLFWLFNPYCPL